MMADAAKKSVQSKIVTTSDPATLRGEIKGIGGRPLGAP